MPFLQIMIAILLISVAAPVYAQHPIEEIYRLTDKGEWPYGALDQTLSFSTPDDFSPPKRWIVERIRHDVNRCSKPALSRGCRPVDAHSHAWIDGDACPQLVPALQELGVIPIPSFAGAGRMSQFGMDHATVLTITGEPTPTPGHWPQHPEMSTLERVSVTEQVGVFNTWWRKTEAALSECWQPAAPVVDGKQLQTTLQAPQ